MRRDATLFLATIAVLALGGVCWLVFQMVLMEPSIGREDSARNEADFAVPVIDDENRALRLRIDGLEADLATANRRLSEVLSRLERSDRAPAPVETSRLETAPEGSERGSTAELAQEPAAVEDSVPGLTASQHSAVRDVIARVQEEEERRREETRLARELERTTKTVDRLAEQVGFSAVQKDEVNKIYAREVMSRRDLYRGFDFELASEEDRSRLREEGNRLREDRDEAVLRLLDVAQAEKLQELNSRRFRRGRDGADRIQLGGAATPRRNR